MEQALWTRARLGRCGPRLDVMTARFDKHGYAPHAHDEFTVGVCVGGSEVSDYRGGHIRTGPGSIVVLAPGEVHTGSPGNATDGYAYRALPHFREPLTDDTELAEALRLTASCLGLAALVYAPAAAVTWPSTMPSSSVLLALVGLGAIGTAVAFGAFLELIKEVGPTRSTVITYVNPAVAAGALFLGERLTVGVGAAFALILAGSVLATAAGPAKGGGPVTWSTRQTSRADGRVESP